jgi:excisionase family DNA binding protein
VKGEPQSPRTNTEDRLLTVHDAAEYLALAVGSIYHMAADGRLPCVRLSARCLRFRRSALDRFIDGRSV